MELPIEREQNNIIFLLASSCDQFQIPSYQIRIRSRLSRQSKITFPINPNSPLLPVIVVNSSSIPSAIKDLHIAVPVLKSSISVSQNVLLRIGNVEKSRINPLQVF
ncbi:uncharacterized protein LOC127796860 [Diospyros lotus]|uniref:uncharacterized protein LOC127796860 n=1 Tax=Diospyros lotus TaxID=55363 RepID=UPI00224C99F1|nr:uncharacterized protein LOC127796860 [Diospyros lotus]